MWLKEPENGIDNEHMEGNQMNKYLNIVDIPPVDGCDIITTIDVGMQDIIVSDTEIKPRYSGESPEEGEELRSINLILK